MALDRQTTSGRPSLPIHSTSRFTVEHPAGGVDLAPDGVHLKPNGYKVLGEWLLKDLLAKPTP